MYSSLIRHLYIVLCVHHPKSSLLPSSFIPPLPCSTPALLPSDSHQTVVYGVLCVCFCLIPSPFSPSPATPPSTCSCQSVPYLRVSFYSLFCLFILFTEIIGYRSLPWFMEDNPRKGVYLAPCQPTDSINHVYVLLLFQDTLHNTKYFVTDDLI